MKKLTLITALMLMPATAFAQLITVEVKGMTCAGCAGTVKASLAQLPEVKDVVIDVKAEKAAITLKDINAAPTDAALKEAVKKAGYAPGAVTR